MPLAPRLAKGAEIAEQWLERNNNNIGYCDLRYEASVCKTRIPGPRQTGWLFDCSEANVCKDPTDQVTKDGLSRNRAKVEKEGNSLYYRYQLYNIIIITVIAVVTNIQIMMQ